MHRATLALVIALFASLYAVADAPKWPVWNGTESIADYAARAKLAPTLTLDLGDGTKWEGVLIPAGNFTMGSPDGEAKTPQEAASEKQHKVTITAPFYLG